MQARNQGGSVFQNIPQKFWHMQKTGNFNVRKTIKYKQLRYGFKWLQSSQQLSKYNWVNFSSKQKRFYFTKSSRGPDSTSQRTAFGPRAVCLTPLRYVQTDQMLPERLLRCCSGAEATSRISTRHATITWFAFIRMPAGNLSLSQTRQTRLTSFPGRCWMWCCAEILQISSTDNFAVNPVEGWGWFWVYVYGQHICCPVTL